MRLIVRGGSLEWSRRNPRRKHSCYTWSLKTSLRENATAAAFSLSRLCTRVDRILDECATYVCMLHAKYYDVVSKLPLSQSGALTRRQRVSRDNSETRLVVETLLRHRKIVLEPFHAVVRRKESSRHDIEMQS